MTHLFVYLVIASLECLRETPAFRPGRKGGGFPANCLLHNHIFLFNM